MPKPRVAPGDKRVIIAARVSRKEKALLLAIGGGNVSRGLDRVMDMQSRIPEKMRWDLLAAATTPRASCN